MTPRQVLWRVELPLALPLIFAGVRTATVYVVATATLATFAGGGGLGDIIVNEPTYGTGGVIAGSLAITVLAFAIDGLLALVQHAVTPSRCAASGCGHQNGRCRLPMPRGRPGAVVNPTEEEHTMSA